MSNHLFLRGIACGVLAIAVLSVDAQVKKKKSTAKTTTTTAKDPFGGASKQTPASTKTPKNPFAAPNNSSVDPFGASASKGNNGNGDTTRKSQTSGKDAPLVVVKTATGNPLTDSNKVSLRNDNAVEANLIKDRTPLIYDYIREDDAIFKQRIWRIIDAREKMNLPFKNTMETDNGSQLFFAILYKSVAEGGIVAFEDERFTTPFTKDKFKERFSGGTDTVPVYGDLNNPELITSREVRTREFPVDSVYRFQIKEEVLFDKEASRLVTRILGIAPMGPQILPNGKVLEGPPITYFWIYYPDIRATLAKFEVYNPKNFGNRMTWEDLFEQRFYSSYIVKTTMDNPYNQSLADKYGKNKLFMLLEGEAIKEKIFNYEQDLWAY
ncbi:gliding motility protein GldN [Parasediminibacterium paludis]|uniref:Gliding motility protein GldN n=1 Tax=Parasediminibacterium paludis TaxID=908966 RepID=A0ABV8PXK7_9BACT